MDARELERLKTVALNATQGEWHATDFGWQHEISDSRSYSFSGKGLPIAVLAKSLYRDDEQYLRVANATYIAAASPATMLRLLARIVELETALRVVVNCCEATPGGGLFVDKSEDFKHIAKIAKAALASTGEVKL